LIDIRVSDAGPGVPPDFVPHLFGRFTRIGNADDGAGLGLSIGAELACLNGGSAHYGPLPPGHAGATFTVCLPHRAPSRRGVSGRRPDDSAKDPQPSGGRARADYVP
jgi:signal transduction histidine kinase